MIRRVRRIVRRVDTEAPALRVERRHQTKAIIEALLPDICAHYQVKPLRVSIRRQRTRWGSCSKKGTLSFNHRLCLLSPVLQEYVLVHEVCHLLAFDHSRRFWALVEQKVPRWHVLRRELRGLWYVLR